MVANRDWGPLLWRILHGMAEYTGKQGTALLATDEVNEMIFCLRDLEHIMPCPMCRSHYRAWRKDHPLEQIAALRGSAFREAVRLWLYNLHENVNRQRDVVSNITISDCETLYMNIPIRDIWIEYGKIIQGSLYTRQVSLSALQNFTRHFTLFRKLVGK
jgi:hypothetical protein